MSHVNINDGTVAGVRQRELPLFSIQYHSETSPGLQDTVNSFERFIQMVKKVSNGTY